MSHGEVDALLLDVGDYDALCARRLAHGRCEQANGAGAEDENSGSFGEGGAVTGVQRDG